MSTTRNITHLQTLELSLANIDKNMMALHSGLSQLYVLLNRPIDNTSQEQALTLLHAAMSRLRQTQEDKTFITNAAVGIDSDLADIIVAINRVRFPRQEVEYTDKWAGDTLTPRSGLRNALDEVDEVLQRGRGTNG